MDLNGSSKNIYFVGIRSSDIAVTFDAHKPDPFFKGSITCYGDGKNGNVSYNTLSGIQLCTDNLEIYKRNEAIYKKFVGTQCRKIVEQDSSALFLPYSVYYGNMIPEEFSKRIICCNNQRLLAMLDSKFKFKKLIKNKLNQAPFEIKRGSEILKMIQTGIIPCEKEVVIQVEYGTGGKGTILATKESLSHEDYFDYVMGNINPKTRYVLSNYIEHTYAASLQIMVAENEIALYPPGVQLMNGPSFIGTDLFKFAQLDDGIKEEVIKVARQFGRILRTLHEKKGIAKPLRGYFGLDILISKEETPRVFVVECNPRLTGVTGLMNILCHKAGIGSVYEHMFQAFYSSETSLAKQFQKIIPNGRKIYAEVKRDENGKLQIEEGGHNKEGLDETVYQEEGIYTYSIFEEIRNFNVFDYMVKHKKFAIKIPRKKKQQVAAI